MVARESQLVALVDAHGAATGSCTVAEAHTAPGRLHRAFSVMLLDDLGRALIQQRAAEKTRFALRWANACCGHLASGQTVFDAAAQRLIEEIGVHGVTLHQAGVHLYRAEDPQTGWVEHEYDHVLVGRVPVNPRLHLDPAEVADVRWLAPDWLRVDLADNPDRYAPWLRGALAVTTEAAGHLTSYPFPAIQQEARPGAVGAGAVPSTAGTTATRPESANQTPRLKPAQHNR